jgi:hypothetical protein
MARSTPYFDQFVEAWRNRRPLVGDPMTATDQRPRETFDPRLQRGSETSVPTQPFRPNPGHSSPPAGQGPAGPRHDGQPITPNSKPVGR